jgi:hypothetical protein
MEQENTTTKSESLNPKVLLIPKVVRIYGMMFMIGSAIFLCFSIGNMLFGGSIVRSVGAINSIYAFVYFLIGLGLWKGKRSSVIGMTIVAAFSGLLMLFFLIAIGESLGGSLLLLAFGCAIYAPPLISAYRNWEQFH